MRGPAEQIGRPAKPRHLAVPRYPFQPSDCV